MKSNFSKILGLFLIIFISVGPILPIIYFSQQIPDSISKIQGPWTLLSPTQPNEVKIIWESDFKSPTGIYYGITPENLTQMVLNPQATKTHYIDISDLIPNTRYYFQLHPQSLPEEEGIPQELQAKIFQFLSKPNSTESEFSFIAISDTQQSIGHGYHPQMAHILSEKVSNTAFLMTVGDLVADGKDRTLWSDYFQVASPYLSNTIFMPVIGNHDGNLGHQTTQRYPSEFHEFFPISQDNFFFLYNFNYSMAHFTICDLQYATEMELNATQLAWIENSLNASQNFPIRIVAFHAPVMSSGYYGNNSVLQQQLKPLLEKYEISLVLNGHDHHYERLEANNITYLVLGSGGAIQDPFDVLRQESQIIAYSPNYTKITCNSTEIRIETFSLSGTIIDQYTIAVEAIN